jgi:hypothetical protein
MSPTTTPTLMDWILLHMDWIYGILLFSLLMLAGAAVNGSRRKVEKPKLNRL